MGTSCSTCFGDSEGNTSQSQSHSQGRHQQGQSGVDRSTKREQMGRAAEERIRATENRAGGGILTKKLSEQKTNTSPAIQLPDSAPLQRVEEALSLAGFENHLPVNNTIFAGGDGHAVEESPIGYYRFHYWKNDEQWKEHENWISNTDVTGLICVSFMQDAQVLDRRNFYRLLFRSIFGTKSVIIFEDDLAEMLGGARPNRTRIIGAGLRMFIEHERDRLTALEDEFGAMSIRSNCTITSLSNELVRNLPSSRLRESIPSTNNAGPSVGLSRRQSMRGGGNNGPYFGGGGGGGEASVAHTINNSSKEDLTPIGFENNLPMTLNVYPERAGSVRKRFKELSKVNPFELAKSFTQVKDSSFYNVLLSLERALDPKVCHVDVVIAEGSTAKAAQRDETWRSFTKILGDRLTKAIYQEHSKLLAKQGRVPSRLVAELIKNQPSRTPVPREKETSSLLDNYVIDFVVNEYSYLCKLRHISKYYLVPLRGDQSMLKREDYIKIFEGFDQFIGLHERLILELSDGIDNASSRVSLEIFKEQVVLKVATKIITSTSIAKVMEEVGVKRELEAYAQLVSDYDERRKAIKEQSENKPRFREYLESLNERTPLDQQFGNFFQHVMRYQLQFQTIIENTNREDPSIPLLMRAWELMNEAAVRLELCKKSRDEAKLLFDITNKINNCPSICSNGRAFLGKMAAYEVEKDRVNYEKRLTLYLFSDGILAARKICNPTGRIYREKHSHNPSTRQRTHEFLFQSPIGETNLKRLDATAKTRKESTKIFTVELPLSATVWHGDRLLPLSLCIENGAHGHYLLAPKKQEKLIAFLEKFNQNKHQSFLVGTLTCRHNYMLINNFWIDSPAEVYMKQVGDKDLYFHVYKQMDYFGWPHKNKLAILYCHQAPLPVLTTLFPEEETEALIVVQGMQSTFRWIVKCRDCLVASLDCFGSSREFNPPGMISDRLTRALLNCHLLYAIYPPFGPSVELQMRQQLERYIEPFSRGLMRRFKELVNKMQKTTEPINTNGGLTDNDTSSIYSVENNSIFEDSITDKPPLNDKKKSVLGKMFGRIKSPLAKKLDDIPE